MSSVQSGRELISVHGREMHHIPYVQVEDPVVRVLQTKHVPHIKFVLVVELEQVYLCLFMKGYFQFVLFLLLFALEHAVSFSLSQGVDLFILRSYTMEL